jgi:hypothetical protein
MRRKVGVLGLALATVAGLALAAPAASAAPAAQQGSNWYGIWGNLDWPVPGALFLNQTRDTYCTPDVVDWEQSFAAWLQDPDSNPDPGEAPFVDGLERAPQLTVSPGDGVVIIRVSGKDLPAELWTFDDDVQGWEDVIAPCIDTDGRGAQRVATGAGSIKHNDNDLFGEGQRGNAWRFQAQAQLTDTAGGEWRFIDRLRATVPQSKDYPVREDGEFGLFPIG